MPRIAVQDAKDWSEKTKLDIAVLEDSLVEQLEAQVLAALANSGYDTSTWADSATTPQLVRSIIAMLYVATLYDRAYAEDVETGNAYSKLLRSMATANLAGIIDGTLILEDAAVPEIA